MKSILFLSLRMCSDGFFSFTYTQDWFRKDNYLSLGGTMNSRHFAAFFFRPFNQKTGVSNRSTWFICRWRKADFFFSIDPPPTDCAKTFLRRKVSCRVDKQLSHLVCDRCLKMLLCFCQLFVSLESSGSSVAEFDVWIASFLMLLTTQKRTPSRNIYVNTILQILYHSNHITSWRLDQ